MATTLHQKLLQALNRDGTLSNELRGEVAAESLKIILGNDSCKVALGSASLADAVDYADTLFLIGWKKMVKDSNGMIDFRRKLTTLCLNACIVKRRRWGGPLDLPMGGYIGPDFPDDVGSY